MEVKLPLLCTRQEVSRALGIPDPRSIRADRLKPVAQLVIGNQIRTLYSYPQDTILAALSVNKQPNTPLQEAR
jgi:hypothetical protein